VSASLKVEGGAQLRTLAAELKTAERTLWLRTARSLRAVAKPAADAVQAEERRVLPKRGGLNEWVASAKVGVRISTTSRSAGVTLRQGRTSGGGLSRSNLAALNNQGKIRHPVYADPEKTRREWHWVDQSAPANFWEHALEGMAPEAMVAMKAVLDETARVAGFRGP